MLGLSLRGFSGFYLAVLTRVFDRDHKGPAQCFILLSQKLAFFHCRGVKVISGASCRILSEGA